jgi:hydrogenase maturation protease
MTTVLIAIGNEYRRDDGAALAVLEELRAEQAAADRFACCDGESARLLELWSDADLAVVLDAVHAHPGEPGRIHELTQHRDAEPGVVDAAADRPGPSSHALGLGHAVDLARALGRLPQLLVVIGIEGEDFSLGQGLSPAVRAAVPAAAARVRARLRSFESEDL